MDIFREIEPLRTFLGFKRHKNASIGLVATMGALHRGHIALIRASKQENTTTVCSIYVNPKQFGNAKDLDNYPRTEKNDIGLLEVEQCDAVFIPDHNVIYDAFTDLQFDFGSLDKIMEGRFRPGHFNGVALVVAKLFNILQPDLAYFGQKDYQQFKIISVLKEELKFPLHLRCISTVREPDGLAFSSRNQRLTDRQRKDALYLINALNFAKKAMREGVCFADIHKDISNRFTTISTLRLDYFELAHCDTLELLDDMGSLDRAIILIAAYVGNVRLIDNMIVDLQSDTTPVRKNGN